MNEMILLTQSCNPLPDVGAVKIFIPSKNSNGSLTYPVKVDGMLFYVIKEANVMWIKKDSGLKYSDELLDFIGNLIDKVSSN